MWYCPFSLKTKQVKKLPLYGLVALCIIIFVVALSGGNGNDYNSLSKDVTFVNGSSDGADICVSLTVNADSLVEHEEAFVVHLSLVTSGANFHIGNSATMVTIVDSDGQ